MPGVTLAAPRAKTALVPRFQMELGDYVCTAEIAADGELCVIGTGDGNVIGVELATGRERFRGAAHAGGVLGIGISPDSAQFVSCGQEPNAKVWTAAGELEAHQGLVTPGVQPPQRHSRERLAGHVGVALGAAAGNAPDPPRLPGRRGSRFCRGTRSTAAC